MGCLNTLCNCLDRLLECVELAERVLVDLRGLFGAEHLGTCIKAACCNDTGHTDTGCVTGNDVVTVESAGAAATVDRVAEEREPDCDTHGTTEVGAWEAGLVLEQVVEVEQGCGDCLCEPSGTTVDHGCREGACGCIGIPEHRVLGVVEDVAALALLACLDDFVLNGTLDEALNDSTRWYRSCRLP